jgi:hypothetical protein
MVACQLRPPHIVDTQPEYDRQYEKRCARTSVYAQIKC